MHWTTKRLMVVSFLGAAVLGLPSCTQTSDRRTPDTTVEIDGVQYEVTDNVIPTDAPPLVSSDRPSWETEARGQPGGLEQPEEDAASTQKTADDRRESVMRALERKRLGDAEAKFDADDYSIEEEALIGEATARSILKRYQYVPLDSAAATYVRKLGVMLARESARPDLIYRFAILTSDTPNAFSAPAGYVFVTTGLVRYVQNEAELAFVLAHEIGHIAGKHGLQTLAEGELDRQKRAARERAAELKTLPENPTAKEIEERMDSLADLVLKGKGSPQEHAADRFAVELIAAVGYCPQAAVTLLERINAIERPPDAEPAIFRSHPYTRERLDAVRAQVAGMPAGGLLLADRFKRNLAGL